MNAPQYLAHKSPGAPRRYYIGDAVERVSDGRKGIVTGLSHDAVWAVFAGESKPAPYGSDTLRWPTANLAPWTGHPHRIDGDLMIAAQRLTKALG